MSGDGCPKVDLEGAFLTLSGGKGVRELWGTVSGAVAPKVDLEGALLNLTGGKRLSLIHI